jgi:hypothetical protein
MGKVDPKRLAHLISRELTQFECARNSGDLSAGWHALERAHIVSQAAFLRHAITHIRMLGFAIEQREWGEAVGQAFRLLLVPIGHGLGRLPMGNTGRSNVSAFKGMPLPDDLAAEFTLLNPIRQR